MPFLPVAAREVREAARQPRTYGWRCGAAGTGLLLMTFVFWVARHDPGNLGGVLFVAISIAAFIYCLVAGVVRTADAISEEKRDNTLGLLFLTDLKGWDIISGKLLSSSVNLFFGLISLIPMMAVPIMMGGVGFAEFARVVLGLITVLFISITWGFLVSTLFRQSAVTISLGLLLAIFFGGLLPLASMFALEEYRLKTLSEILFLFSPLQGFILAFDSNKAPFNHYWLSILVNHVIAWSNLALAVYFLPRFWQEAPKSKKTERWRERFRRWRFGAGKAKSKFRERLLNQNPLFWLANRDQISSGGVMTIAAAILTLSLIFGAIAGRTSFRNGERLMVSWLVGLALVHMVVAFRMAMAASWRLAEDRRSGALELMLATELSIRDILRGNWMAFGRQFFGPMLIVLLASLFGLAMVLVAMSSEFDSGGLFQTLGRMYQRMREDAADGQLFWVFLIIFSIMTLLCMYWIGLGWVGMWLGLREKRAGFGTWNTLALVHCPPWIAFAFLAALADDAGFFHAVPFSVGIRIMFATIWTLGLGHLLIISFWARRNLLKQFREAAADRFMVSRRFNWRVVRRIAFRFAAAGAVFVLILFSARTVINRRGEAAWNRALAAHKSFPLVVTNATFSELKTPKEKNLARAPVLLPLSESGKLIWSITWTLTSVSQISGLEEMQWAWPLSRTRDLEQIEQRYVRAKAVAKQATPAATVLAGLKKFDAKLDELHLEAIDRPETEFPVQPKRKPMNFWANGGASRAALRGLVDVLSLRASAHIAEKAPALDDVFLALRLIEGIHDGPSLMDTHSMIIDAIQPVYDGLASHAWNNDDLKRIQEKFAALDPWPQYQAWRENYLRELISGFEESVEMHNASVRPPRQSWVGRQFPTGFIRTREAAILTWGLEEMPTLVDTQTHRIDVKRFHALEQMRPTLNNGFPDEWTFTMNSLGFVQTALNHVTLACALERFRNEYGKLPNSADELTPNYLPKVPGDPFTGKPMILKFRDDSQSYIICGAGQDGEYNGGRALSMSGQWLFWQKNNGDDLVWDSQPRELKSSKRKAKK